MEITDMPKKTFSDNIFIFSIDKLLDATLRAKPAIVRDLATRKVKLAFVPWSASIRGLPFFGKRVRVLRGVSIDARRGRISIGDNSVICRFACLEAAGGSIKIGSRTSVGDFSNVYGQGGSNVGSDVLIASGVRIVPSSHNFADSSRPISHQGMTFLGIEIGDGAWLGTNSVILDGSCVGAGAIIGAGAVVKSKIPDNSVAVGLPARVIREKR